MNEITVSLVMLTYYRKEAVKKSLKMNLLTAGYPISEIIHVDNGSGEEYCHWFRETFKPAVQIIHSTNQGVAKGYNRGMLLATSSHIMITGCDRIMPPQWLFQMVNASYKVANTGVVSLYSAPTKASLEGKIKDRVRGPSQHINGLEILPSFACEARLHSKQFLKRTGLFREELGLYGYEDVEWCERAERVAREDNLINYIIPSLPFAEHITQDREFAMPDGEPYSVFKERENDDERKREFVHHCWAAGSPYYNPYI